MAFWFNNFLEFERKQKRENNLILNFYYCSENEINKNVKVFVPRDVLVPSSFIPSNKLNVVYDELRENEFNTFPLDINNFNSYSILNIKLPNNPFILHKLPRNFQRGNYEKLLKFGGFYPGRKVKLESSLEKRFLEEDKICLDNLDGIIFEDFPSLEETNLMPWVVLDIEKPLWKKDIEKRNLNWRNNLVKEGKKVEEGKLEDDLFRQEKRKRILNELEKRLRWDVEGVGNIKIYEDKFKADVSFIGVIWNNQNKILKELYLLDPNDEIKDKQHSGFQILKFKQEKDLVSKLLDNFHERKPVFSFGHNQVYDYTQLKSAAERGKIVFDPSIGKIQPRRDFVRKFLQRLKQDLTYVDTLWLSRIFYSFLSQKRFGTNFKLSGVANHLNVEFEKSLTHEELRKVEVRRLIGKTKELREESAEKMMKYTCADLEVTKDIVTKMQPFEFLLKMQKILPFCTLSEIAFSTNCMNKLHEFSHFSKFGNLPYYGYKQKERQDELQIFKKRFPSKKLELLRWVDLKKAKKGVYSDLQEFYVSFEEPISDIAFEIEPCLKDLYRSSKEDDKTRFIFLQYLKAYMNPILTDYYFARREEKVFNYAKKFSNIQGIKFDPDFEMRSLDSLLGSFKYLKNHFRSIYASLNGKDRAQIRPTNKNLREITFPPIMKYDVDLFLLREKANIIRDNLTPQNKKNLKSFLNNFRKFENYVSEISEFLVDKDSSNKFNSLYGYIQLVRSKESKKKFFAKYNVSTNRVKEKIHEGYHVLADQLKENQLTFIDNIGDYIFVSGKKDIPNAIKIRDIERYEVK